jgi:hypothetical protein
MPLFRKRCFAAGQRGNSFAVNAVAGNGIPVAGFWGGVTLAVHAYE